MQEHVELEVSLEIIMAEIAQKIFELSKEKDENKKTVISQELENLINMQDEAYKGNRKTIKDILALKKEGEF